MILKLKQLTAFVGADAFRFTNLSAKDGNATPIELDTDSKIVTVHKSANEKHVIDLNKIVMYSYEIEPTILQS